MSFRASRLQAATLPQRHARLRAGGDDFVGMELPEPVPEREDGTIVYRPGMTMADMEREAISAALLHSRGNRRRAAEMLGIGERTLYRKLKEYHIED